MFQIKPIFFYLKNNSETRSEFIEFCINWLQILFFS